MDPVANRQAGAEAFPSIATVIATTFLLVTGLALGASGPPFYVSFGAGLVAGPTWSGIVLLLAILTAIISALVGVIALLIGRGASSFGAVFLASIGLVVGFFGGTTVGSAADIGGWAPRPTAAPLPSFPIPPLRVTYEASGEVTVTLEDVTGFTQPTHEAFGDGVYGHWCYSNPEEKAVSEIETLEVGALDGSAVRAKITLTDPYSNFEGWSVAIPHIAITAEDEQGAVRSLWAGPATVIESDTSTGRLTFAELPVDGAYHSESLPATISGEATWRCGAWHER
ncbi:MAG TPA: hypothetical protein VFO73_09650 [Candidatus Limnocylindrales bacterium]|nr:hypothetical protein [Candidatus Limnocylindrales bacterium]